MARIDNYHIDYSREQEVRLTADTLATDANSICDALNRGVTMFLFKCSGCDHLHMRITP